MPRNISFALTTKQFRDRTKTVTRRLKWLNLKAGDILQGVEKCQGLKPGEKVVKLGLIRVTNVRRERLTLLHANPEYGKQEAINEGFPELDGLEFIQMFCKSMQCDYSDYVTRIEYEYLD